MCSYNLKETKIEGILQYIQSVSSFIIGSVKMLVLNRFNQTKRYNKKEKNINALKSKGFLFSQDEAQDEWKKGSNGDQAPC